MAKKKKRTRRTKAQMAEACAKQAKATKKEKKQKRHRRTKAELALMKPLVTETTPGRILTHGEKSYIPDTVNEKEWKENFTEPVQKNGRKRRRTKAEMLAAKNAIHDSDWDEKKNKPKKARKPKMKDKVEPLPNGFDETVFTAKERPKLSSEELRTYLREKYTPNAGLRSPDYILQLCDINEHLENELGIATKKLKG